MNAAAENLTTANGAQRFVCGDLLIGPSSSNFFVTAFDQLIEQKECYLARQLARRLSIANGLRLVTRLGFGTIYVQQLPAAIPRQAVSKIQVSALCWQISETASRKSTSGRPHRTAERLQVIARTSRSHFQRFGAPRPDDRVLYMQCAKRFKRFSSITETPTQQTVIIFNPEFLCQIRRINDTICEL